HPNHLIAFYTSTTTLKVSFSEGQRLTPGVTTQYDVKGNNGVKLIECHIDPAWRETRPESLEFVVMGLKGGRSGVALMLLENVGGVYYRVNWDWRLTQYLSVERWMDQNPVQKLIVLG